MPFPLLTLACAQKAAAGALLFQAATPPLHLLERGGLPGTSEQPSSEGPGRLQLAGKYGHSATSQSTSLSAHHPMLLQLLHKALLLNGVDSRPDIWVDLLFSSSQESLLVTVIIQRLWRVSSQDHLLAASEVEGAPHRGL